MQHHRKLTKGWSLVVATGFALPSVMTVAVADSVPESIRLQEKAEKAYESAPVRPIDRGNAHHRDVKDESGAEDGTMTMPPPVPMATDRHDMNR